MKPIKLSNKRTLEVDTMNFNEMISEYRQNRHDSSFDDLELWLDQNPKRKKEMKPIFKIALSVIIASLITVACSLPVQHEEEIGYLLKGTTSQSIEELLASKGQLSDLSQKELSIHYSIHGNEDEVNQNKAEVMLMLPEANMGLAEEKKEELNRAFIFNDLQIMPIKEKVERSVFSTALKTFNIRLAHNLSDAEIAQTLNDFLHEHSSVGGHAKIMNTVEGMKFVEIELSNLEDQLKEDNIKLKQGVERLYQDLSKHRFNVSNLKDKLDREAEIKKKNALESQAKESIKPRDN